MSDQLCTLSSQDLSLAVAPLGAEMQYLRTAAGQDLLWHGDAAFWTGRAPVLFPIVGRAVNDTVEAGGLTSQMAQHGFARRQVFELEQRTDTQCRHILRASPATQDVFPFDFNLSVWHELAGATLSVTAKVTNEGDAPMPFGFGFHPAFRLPLPGTTGTSYVSLSRSNNLEQRPLRPDGLLDDACVPGPFKDGRVDLTDALFADGALVFPNGSEALRFGATTGPTLEFSFDNLPDLALWRPVGAPFLCIEPWHGTASVVGDGPEIAERPNSMVLAPGASTSFRYQARFSPSS